ncbi:MAG: divergent polysaccharide deacetylase family protein [Woeseiaceae bacterium]|nr:divergent polysaccharide deacetylase family protein [Woeseiaceae bacterium]
MTVIVRLVIAALAALPIVAAAAEAPRIAIIIDDLGYELAAGRRAIELPGAVTCAILPNAPRSAALARSARQHGKEVLLHLPMQAVSDRSDGEALRLTLDMSRSQLAATLDAALTSVPDAVGVNNHRGSLITRHPGHMRWLMEEIRLREPLFFVDSYTTHESIALQVAGEAGVPAIKRDVFLDADPEPETIRAEFERLKRLARERGVAVGIAHPYDTTLEFLEAELQSLARDGYELVPVSALFVN